jgi:Spy/CpxP family protein refolding chaperone
MRSLVLAGIALAVAAPLAAQHHHGEMRPGAAPMGQGHAMCQEMMKGGGMMGGGMMSPIMQFAPERLLEHSEHLGLTTDQTTRLTALRDAAAKAAEQAHEPAMAAHQKLDQAFKETPQDTVAIRQYFMAHQTAMSNTHWIRANAALQARAILTPEQRMKIE